MESEYTEKEDNAAAATAIFQGIAEIQNKMVEAENLQAKPFYTGNELLRRNTQSIPYLVEHIFPKVGLVGLAGSSDTGKSSWLRQLAIDTVLGRERFLGFRLKADYRRAIYGSTEDDDSAISFLLNKANKAYQLSPDAYEGLTFIFDSFNLLERLDEMLSEQRADLVIIDAFTDLYGKSMNDTNQVRTFLNDYSQLAQKHHCLVVFLHHTGKRTEELAPSKHNLLGSQGFEAKMRTVIELRCDQVEADIRHMCIVKANYLPKEFKTESFVLRFDENLRFTNTGERRPFNELSPNSKTDLKEAVHTLKNEGKTQKEIADKLKISQATVSRYLSG